MVCPFKFNRPLDTDFSSSDERVNWNLTKYLKFFLEVSLITRYISGPGAMSYSLSSTPSNVCCYKESLGSPVFLFFPAWVVGWTTLALKGLRSEQARAVVGILFFGLVTGLLGYTWLWNLCGKEELEFTACALIWKRTLLGISRNRAFRMNGIDNPHFENSRSRGKSRIPSGIGFSCEGKELRIGDHLTQRDAKEIVAAVIRQLPELGQCWGSYTEGLRELNEDMSLDLR
jgi:hypothetical protein